MKNTTLALVALLLVAACGGKETATNAPASNPVTNATQPGAAAPANAGAPAAQAAVNSAAPAPAAAGTMTGKIVETMNSGGYTYMNLDSGKGTQWVAVRETKVKKGETVTVSAQMTMEKFESKTLNRTFDTIIFGVMGNEAQAAPAAMPANIPPAMAAALAKQNGQAPQGAAAMNPMMASAMGGPNQHMKAPDAHVKVEKAAGGRSVAEIWAAKDSLKGQNVVVRGKVVKFLGGIMGSNWMHIQDGTGSGAKGDNDITVTTDDTVAVGDVVTVKGTLTVDKDFGAGYRYAAIIEKASVTK